MIVENEFFHLSLRHEEIHERTQTPTFRNSKTKQKTSPSLVMIQTGKYLSVSFGTKNKVQVSLARFFAKELAERRAR